MVREFINPEEIIKALRAELEKRVFEVGPEKTLAVLRNVGPEKPVGDLPLDTIVLCGTDPQTLIDEARAKGLSARIADESEVGRSALYVWHEQALQELLNANREVLERSGWPDYPVGFIGQIAIEEVSPRTQLFQLIADAYADWNNPGRLSPGGRQQGKTR